MMEIRRTIIFVVAQIPEQGGRGRSIERLGEALRQSGTDVHYLSLARGLPVRDIHSRTVLLLGQRHNGPAIRGRRGPGRLNGIFTVIAKRVDILLARVRFNALFRRLTSRDVVIFSDLKDKLVLGKALPNWRRNKPISILQHHTSFEAIEGSWREHSYRSATYDIDLLVALTQHDADKFQAVTDCPTAAVPNMRPKYRAASAPKNIMVSIARYTPEKQLHRLIDCFDRAASALHDQEWELRLYGEGPERARLQQYRANCAVPERIHIMGYSDDIESALQYARFNLLTSKYEGMPLSILEAAAMNVPTIAFDCSHGVRELVTSTGGMLVPNQDFDALRETLEGALRSPNDSLKNVGDQRQMRQYEESAVLEKWQDIFDAIDQNRKGERRRETNPSSQRGTSA